ncbi:hypothetical protein Q7P35_010601 [Cladosporium inversicolor]
MQAPTRSSIAAASRGPALFHSAMERFRRTTPANGAISTRRTRFAGTADETSSEESDYEIVDEDIGAATRPHTAKNDIATMERRHDSGFGTTVEQAAISRGIGTLTPRPPRKDLRAALRTLQDPRQHPGAPSTKADDMATEDDDDDYESLAIMRQRDDDGHARLKVYQQQLDQIAAGLQAEHAARGVQELAAGRKRAWEAQIRTAREQKEAAAGRLAQRIVAEVVPMSASGRAYGDVKEIRRCAAPKVEYQTVPDSCYPRFRPSK